MTKRLSQKGFTYIEMLMAITIISVMALVAGPLLAVSIDLINAHMDRYNLEQAGSMAMNRMTREIRRLRNDQSVATANATTFSFYDVDDTLITFSASGSSVSRSQNPPGSGSFPLLENLQSGSLAFTYYDDNGNTIAAPVTGANNTDIRRIEIEMTLEDPSGQNELPVMTTVRPRNLKHAAELFA